MGDWHGGAIEEAAKMLQEGATKKTQSVEDTAGDILRAWKDTGKRLPGFGHPTHTADPRTRRLLEIAKETGLHGPHVKLAQTMEALTGKFFGKQLILNVDGCIAAIISDMGFDWRLGKGFFIVSRTPGLIAHMSKIYYDKPYKAAHWSEIDYTGPPERKVPGT